MTKICPVILNNRYVTVVKYEKTEVQFPAVKKDVDTLLVDYDGEKYKIVDSAENAVEMKTTSKEKRVKAAEKKNEG